MNELLRFSRENARLRDRVAELEGRVRRLSGDDEADRAQRHLGLSVSESKVFGLLVRRGTADHGMLAEVIYDEDLPEDMVNAVRTVVKRMRRKIRPLGVDATTEYGAGYTMSDAARARARELLGSY